MKLGVILAAVFGALLATGLVAYFGVGSVVSALAAIGWLGFGVYVVYGVAVYVLLGGAWFSLAPGEPAERFPSFAYGRMVRESASDLLPFSSLGGVVIGARALNLGGVDADLAYGSMAVDLVTEIVAQLAFTALGVALLLQQISHATSDASAYVLPAVVGLGATMAGGAGLLVFQRRGLGLLQRLAERWLPEAAAGHVQGARQVIGRIYRQPARLILSVAFHACAWVASALGSWVALRFMGVAIPIPAVLAIESLLSVLKSVAFLVPNAIGVQEGGYALIGALFGLGPQAAIALSLLRRGRDLAIGVPALLAWQALEGRRLLRPGVQPTGLL